MNWQVKEANDKKSAEKTLMMRQAEVFRKQAHEAMLEDQRKEQAAQQAKVISTAHVHAPSTHTHAHTRADTPRRTHTCTCTRTHVSMYAHASVHTSVRGSVQADRIKYDNVSKCGSVQA